MDSTKFNDILRRIIEDRDKNAMEELYNEYAKVFFVIAHSYCHDPDSIKDICHEIVLRIWQIKKYTYTENPKAWLFILCRNVSLKFNDRQIVKHEHVPLDEAVHTADNDGQLYKELEFNLLIDFLPPVEQDILRLKFILCLSLNDIAKTLGLPYGTVSSKYTKALKKISTQINNKNNHI